jgi:rare lipoprotein A
VNPALFFIVSRSIEPKVRTNRVLQAAIYVSIFVADIINMKKKYLFLLVLSVSVFVPFQLIAQSAESLRAEIFRQEGIASWYGNEFNGRPTASGEIFDSSQMTAAHPTLPFNTMLVVINQHNNRSVIVRVNDRGPFVSARIIDISRAAAEQLDMIVTGTAPVIIQSIEQIVIPSSPAGTHAEPQAALLTTFVENIYITESPAQVFSSQPQTVQPPALRIIPDITIVPAKNYRLQVGSFTTARYAVDAFEKLKNAGLDPAYERFTNSNNVEYYRVVVAGVRGTDIQSAIEKISAAGFIEALIREEN